MSNTNPPAGTTADGLVLDAELRNALQQTNLLSFAGSSEILRSYRIVGTLGAGNSPVYLVRKLPDDEHRSDFAMKVILRSSEREFKSSMQEVARTREFSGNHHIVDIFASDSAQVSAYGHTQYAVVLLMPIYANYSKPVSFFKDGRQVDYRPWADTIREADQSATLSFQTLNRLYVVRDVALALGEIARAGRVHRDVKPENIMCTPGDVNTYDRSHLSGAIYCLGDFGEAESDVHYTQHARGTPLWMAPEVAMYCAPAADMKHSGSYQVDIRSDVYSLGLVLYAMFCHWQPPFLADRDSLVPADQLSDEGRKALHRASSSGGLSTGFKAVQIRSSVAPKDWPALALFADRPLNEQEANIRDRVWNMVMHMCTPAPANRWSPEDVSRYVSRLITEIYNGRVQPVPTGQQPDDDADTTLRDADGTIREVSAPQPPQPVPAPTPSYTPQPVPTPAPSYTPQPSYGFLEPLPDYSQPIPAEGASSSAQPYDAPVKDAYGFVEPLPDYDQLNSQQNGQPKPRRRGSWLALVLILLLLLLGAGAWCLLSGDGEEPADPGKPASAATESVGNDVNASAVPEESSVTEPPTATPPATPTAEPTDEPTVEPTDTPTPGPTAAPVTAPVHASAPTAAPTVYPYDAGKTFIVPGESYSGPYKLHLSLDEEGRIDFIYLNTTGLTDGPGRLCGGNQTNKFPRQFYGQTGPFVLGENVDAISGATITSGDIVTLINKTIEKIKTGELR